MTRVSQEKPTQTDSLAQLVITTGVPQNTPTSFFCNPNTLRRPVAPDYTKRDGYTDDTMQKINVYIQEEKEEGEKDREKEQGTELEG